MDQRRANVALLVMLAVSGAVNILLAVKVRSVEGQLRSAAPAPVPRIKVASHLEDNIGVDPAGGPLTNRYADSQTPTVLLILRPGCHWCDANMPNWQTLIQEKGQNFRFVAVSLSPNGFGKYVEGSKLNAPAVYASFGQNPTLNDVTVTPQTVVVDRGGTVRKMWFGAFTHEIKGDVESFFGVKLPVEIPSSS